MNPHVELIDNADLLSFTLSGINVSLANALRRTIISDIKTVVFRTTPYEQNKCTVIHNTSRLNNEVVKQRLSCIPIHINDIENFPLDQYLMEVDVENNTDTIMYVTTENFVITDLKTGIKLSEDKTREIFPADDITGYFIDFVRLRPKISEELLGERIHLTCAFDIGSAKEDGMFNAVSTCSYGFTEDPNAQEIELVKKKQTWKDEGKNENEIKFETENWKLLDAKRIYKENSFDFVIQTVGVFTNNEIVDIGCKVLLEKLENVNEIIEKDEIEIKNSENTMANCFDIILENEDYTIGKILEYLLNSKFYEPKETKVLTYCGFKKNHPHDTYSIIRVAFIEAVEKTSIKGYLKECVDDAIQLFTKLKKDFAKLVV
jgi:DNA-directed RNA polymerase alpha subunit